MRKIGLILFSFLVVISTWSQGEISVTALRSLLQSDRYNPAHFHQDGIYFGAPSIMFNIFHTGTSLDRVLDRAAKDKPVLRVGNLLSNLKEKNILFSDFHFQSFKFKYGLEKWTFGFDHQIVFHSEFFYPDELIKLYVNGNQQYIGERIDIGLDAKLFGYNSYGINVSHSFPGFTLGIRPSILFGNYFGNTPKSKAIFTTSSDVYQLTLETDYQFENVGFLSFENANFLNYRFESLDRWKLFSKNIGIALDVGLDFPISDDFGFSISVGDIGFINWKDRVRSYHSNSLREYTGAEVNDLFNIDEIDITGTLDSLRSIFSLTERSDNIRFRLTSRWIASGYYQVTNSVIVTLLVTGAHETFKSPVTLALVSSKEWNRWLSAGISWSNRHDSFNLGVHAIVKYKKLRGFLIADQVLHGVRWLGSKQFTIRAGVNYHLIDQEGSLD